MSHILPSHEVQCMLFFAILPSPMNYICTTNPFQNATAKYTVLHVVLQKQGKSGDYLARYDCSAFYASVALASAGADSVFSFSFFSSLSFLSLSPLLRRPRDRDRERDRERERERERLDELLPLLLPLLEELGRF